MYQYRVTADQVKVHGGKVQLDKESAKKRMYGLKETAEPGIYEVLKTLYFAKDLTFGHIEKLTYGVECLNAEPAVAKVKTSLNVEKGVMLNAEGQKKREAYLKGETFQAVEGSDDGGAQDGITLKQISEALEHKTQKETKELLLEKYDCKVEKGADLIPEAVVKQVFADFNLAFEDEVNPDANQSD